MPCALAAVVFGIPKVQSRQQASKRACPEKAGIEPSLENGAPLRSAAGCQPLTADVPITAPS